MRNDVLRQLPGWAFSGLAFIAGVVDNLQFCSSTVNSWVDSMEERPEYRSAYCAFVFLAFLVLVNECRQAREATYAQFRQLFVAPAAIEEVSPATVLSPEEQSLLERMDELARQNLERYAVVISPIGYLPMLDPVRITGQPPEHVFDRFELLSSWGQRERGAFNPMTNLACSRELIPALEIAALVEELRQQASQNRSPARS